MGAEKTSQEYFTEEESIHANGYNIPTVRKIINK
jgi:hypothetical protein